MGNLLGSSKLFVKRNASTILTVMGGVGVIATSVMAVKATPKALDILERAKTEKGEELTKVEKVTKAAPVYIPSVLVGVSTIACIFGANVLNKRQQAALVSAYTLLNASYKEYQNKVKEMVGDDGEIEIRDEIVKDKYAGYEKKEYDDTELFYDEYSGRYFSSTKYKVQHAVYELNRDIHMRGWVTLNEFYEHLGIEGIDDEEVLGWSEGGNLARYWQGWIDFSYRKATMEDGLEVHIIGFFQEPYSGYEDDWY